MTTSTHESSRPSDHAPGSTPNDAPIQFTLVHIFVATALVAVITMIAVTFGPGSLPLSIGLSLAGLNAQGAFVRLQGQRPRSRIAYLAWLMLAVSLVLPTAKGCNQQTIRGWEVAQAVAAIEVQGVKSLATGEEALDVQNVTSLAFFTMINLANILVLASPLLLYQLKHGKGRILGNALAFSTASVWLLAWDDFPDTLVGYYVWAGGITLLFLTTRPRWWVVIAMGLVAVLFLVLM